MQVNTIIHQKYKASFEAIRTQSLLQDIIMKLYEFGKSISHAEVSTVTAMLPMGVRTGSAVSTGRWETTTSEGWMRGLSSVVRRRGSTLRRWVPGEGDNWTSPKGGQQGHCPQHHICTST